jgi:hypothetical protein
MIKESYFYNFMPNFSTSESDIIGGGSQSIKSGFLLFVQQTNNLTLTISGSVFDCYNG